MFRDGRLQEGDQILAINKKVLDSGLTHHEAIAILQQSKGDIELVVAKGVPGSLSRSSSLASSSLSRSSSAVSNASQNSVSIPVSLSPALQTRVAVVTVCVVIYTTCRDFFQTF